MNGCELLPLFPLRNNDSLFGSKTFAQRRRSLPILRRPVWLRTLRRMRRLFCPENDRRAFLRILFRANIRRILRRLMDNFTEYEIRMTVRAQSTLNREKLNQLLVVALWDDQDDSMTPDGASSELRVIEYQRITIEEAV